jgi:DNA-3-methyladenine glycosylase I
MQNSSIIRNRLKIEATIQNARSFLTVQEQYGSFSDYIWQFVDGRPVQNKWKTDKQVPASTRQSETMSKELKRLGFRFVGPTICYAYMQATGMVNDHITRCYRHEQIAKLGS